MYIEHVFFSIFLHILHRSPIWIYLTCMHNMVCSTKTHVLHIWWPPLVWTKRVKWTEVYIYIYIRLRRLDASDSLSYANFSTAHDAQSSAHPWADLQNAQFTTVPWTFWHPVLGEHGFPGLKLIHTQGSNNQALWAGPEAGYQPGTGVIYDAGVTWVWGMYIGTGGMGDTGAIHGTGDIMMLDKPPWYTYAILLRVLHLSLRRSQSNGCTQASRRIFVLQYCPVILIAFCKSFLAEIALELLHHGCDLNVRICIRHCVFSGKRSFRCGEKLARLCGGFGRDRLCRRFLLVLRAQWNWRFEATVSFLCWCCPIVFCMCCDALCIGTAASKRWIAQ